MWGMAWTWPRSTSFAVSDQRKVRSVGHWYNLYSQKCPKDDYVKIPLNAMILILGCKTGEIVFIDIAYQFGGSVNHLFSMLCLG